MKSIKNIIMSAAVLATAGFGLSSCDIDMLPLNEVVLENFWTNRDDVESVVTSCYAAVQSTDYVNDLIVWGECRSDNVAEGANVSDALKYLLKGSIKTKSPYCNWAAMYDVINRCNTVLTYAPIVADKDPNYRPSHLRMTQAECRFLRAYSYFTLIKTFKDVPFTFEASVDDNQNYRLPQTKFEVVLDSLIKDIDECKDYAPLKFSITEKNMNTAKVTRAAMYSLLAELYLWRAADNNLSPAEQDVYYRKCIEACDFVLDYKYSQYKENNFEDIDIRPLLDNEVLNENGYPLLAEELTVGVNNDGPQATNSIFSKGGSFETIFEIKYNGGTGSTQTSNGAVSGMYGDERSRALVASENLVKTKPKDNASYNPSDQYPFSVTSDYRMLASFWYRSESTDWNIYKYRIENNLAGKNGSNYGSVSGTSFKPATTNLPYPNTNYFNWIIYRLTEIMLFRAEAEIELAYHMSAAETDTETEETPATDSKRRKVYTYVTGDQLTTAEDLKNDAFNWIMAVYRRSNPSMKSTPKVAPSMPTDLVSFRSLLMNERRREFLFEGKRYYDLVRISRRDGNTQYFRNALSQKYGEGGAAVTIKMVKMDFMYMPVSYDEMIVNPNLVQNECYLDEIENSKN